MGPRSKCTAVEIINVALACRKFANCTSMSTRELLSNKSEKLARRGSAPARKKKKKQPGAKKKPLVVEEKGEDGSKQPEIRARRGSAPLLKTKKPRKKHEEAKAGGT